MGWGFQSAGGGKNVDLDQRLCIGEIIGILDVLILNLDFILGKPQKKFSS